MTTSTVFPEPLYIGSRGPDTTRSPSLLRATRHTQGYSTLTTNRGTHQKMSQKGKARADEAQETDEDAYGSDDPSYLPNARAGDEREEDGATQGSPKGHKRSRLNSVGEGVPVPMKEEKLKTLFEPLIRDTDGCAVPSLSLSQVFTIFF